MKNCLSGAVSLTKNGDINKDKYSQNGIGFDGKWFFFFYTLVMNLVKT